MNNNELDKSISKARWDNINSRLYELESKLNLSVDSSEKDRAEDKIKNIIAMINSLHLVVMKTGEATDDRLKEIDRFLRNAEFQSRFHLINRSEWWYEFMFKIICIWLCGFTTLKVISFIVR